MKVIKNEFLQRLNTSGEVTIKSDFPTLFSEVQWLDRDKLLCHKASLEGETKEDLASRWLGAGRKIIKTSF